MRLTVTVFLFGLLSAASAFKWSHEHQHPFQDRWSWQDRFYSWLNPASSSPCGCTQPSLSTPCECTDPNSTSEEISTLIGEDNDNDGNGFVSGADVVYDVSTNYDTNKDGVWTDRECVNRWSCRYAGNYTISNYICAILFSGEQNISISVFNNIVGPFAGEGLALSTFLQINQGRYDEFRDSNCVNECLTREQKVEKNAENNDGDNDQLVTEQNIRDDLKTYDANEDSVVTMEEFVKGWLCNYGDSADYARFVWNETFGGNPNITIASVNLGSVPPTGIPTELWKNITRQTYERYVQTVNPSYEDECNYYDLRLEICSLQYLCNKP